MRRQPDPSTDTEADTPAACPYCDGTNTDRDHPKGPSLCRSIHYCNDCDEPFEAMG
ncbi:hypothetical protein HWV07_03850 [Natronomonas salina]|uniref:1,2-phenylacetyl-CoA epoxidase subunit PaaE n=1 Tax=Natronomonas salina TaxID=1710540 RepID=UPI0015B6F2F3|nr:1,2-phenylacetyl-CoA epoxidase subunit PaaE [Natronomonas salina]QLD88212.1 hypothetical protein HWV07_03850 [Natronomonas salina]